MGMTVQFEVGKGKKVVEMVGTEAVEVKEPKAEVEPTQANVEVEASKPVFELKPVEDFGDDKNALEEYGKEFGIDLKKNKSVANMYKDLEDFVASK